jgi:hypothetical protein
MANVAMMSGLWYFLEAAQVVPGNAAADSLITDLAVEHPGPTGTTR